jgi:hypothetical protein
MDRTSRSKPKVDRSLQAALKVGNAYAAAVKKLSTDEQVETVLNLFLCKWAVGSPH